MIVDRSIAMIVAGYTSIVLLFDGSLRSPSDHGFTFILDKRSGSCAACIMFERNETATKNAISISQHDDRPVMLGLKEIAVNSQTSSAEVEFEGLYYGLSKLANVLHTNFSDVGLTVTVNGDCKNVINQMNGFARPRKLEKHFNECKNLIENEMSAHRFVFCHIPRVRNVVCDRLASFAVIAQEYRAEKLLFNDIETLSKNCMMSLRDKLERISLNEEVAQIFENHLKVSSLIRFSVRQSIYRYLLKICALIRDYETILLVSETFQQDVESVLTKKDDEIQILEEIASYRLTASDALGEYNNKLLHKLKRNKNLNWRRIKSMSHAQVGLPTTCTLGNAFGFPVDCPTIETLQQKVERKFDNISPAFLRSIKDLDDRIVQEREIDFWQICSGYDL